METLRPPVPESTEEPSPTTALSRKGIRRFSAVELLVVLVLWLVSSPVVMGMRYGELIEAVLISLVMLSAVVAVGGRRRTLIVAIILVTPACVCKWLNHMRPDLMPPEAHTTAAIVFLVFVVVHLVRFILRAPRVNTEVLCAGISVYLLIGVLWAFSYILVAALSPESFAFSGGPGSGRTMAGLEAIYFSFVTLSTIGYGDVLPTSDASRMLAILEATTGLFYVTILIARLVALYSSEKPSEDTDIEAEA